MYSFEVTEEDFKQPRALWNNVFSNEERTTFIENITPNIAGVKRDWLREKVFDTFLNPYSDSVAIANSSFCRPFPPGESVVRRPYRGGCEQETAGIGV